MDLTVIIVNVVGWLGMALLISAYALVTTGRILGPSLTFQLMNLVGGGLTDGQLRLLGRLAVGGAQPGLGRDRDRRPDPSSASGRRPPCASSDPMWSCQTLLDDHIESLDGK